jgi:tetratricopeptide (TPR) repeat protein
VNVDDSAVFPTPEALDLLVQTDPAAALRVARDWHARAVDGARQSASALSAIARALFELGEVDRAATTFRVAVQAAERAGDPELEFSVVLSASAVFAEAGAVEEALVEIDRISPGNSASQRGRLLTQRSYVLHHAGRLGEALVQLDRAEGEFRLVSDELGWLRLLVNRGLIRLQQGYLEVAERDLLDADRVALRLGQSAMRAGIASNLGVAYGRSRRIRDALEQFRLATELHEAAGRPGRMVAVSQIDRAETLMFAGLLAEALEAAEAAVAHVEPTGNLVVLGDSKLLLAKVQIAFGRLIPGRRTAELAAEMFERAGRHDMAVIARSVAVTALLTGANSRAGREALDGSAQIVVELQRNGWQPIADELRLSRLKYARTIGSVDDAYDDLAYVRLGAFSDQRDQALAGWFAEAIGRDFEGSSESALDACRSGLDLVDDIVAEAPTLRERSAAMRLGSDLSCLAIELAVALGEADTVLAAAEGTRARALHDEMVEQHKHKPLTAEGARRLRIELAARLDGSALIEWVIAADTVWAVVFDQGGSRLVEIGPLQGVLHARDRVVMWLDRAAEEPDASSEGAMRAIATLDRLLLAPLALPPVSRLVVVPVGGLHGIPWSGLPTFAGRAVTLTPNAQLWLEADRRAMGEARTVGLIVGPDVTGVGTERLTVQSLYRDVTVASGFGAGASAVRAMFAGLDVVHVAAHGTFRSDHPLLSTLRLHDGESTLYDTVPQQVRARLVVLSSCQGGAHGTADGSEVLGLAAVMLARGAAAVLAPLTLVRELECADFVADVHACLAEQRSIGEAVAGVRQHWLDDDDLSRWAVASSFTCFGSGAVVVAAQPGPVLSPAV